MLASTSGVLFNLWCAGKHENKVGTPKAFSGFKKLLSEILIGVQQVPSPLIDQ